MARAAFREVLHFEANADGLYGRDPLFAAVLAPATFCRLERCGPRQR